MEKEFFYKVEGNHPILRRIDKKFTSIELAEEFEAELESYDYEVRIIECYK